MAKNKENDEVGVAKIGTDWAIASRGYGALQMAAGVLLCAGAIAIGLAFAGGLIGLAMLAYGAGATLLGAGIVIATALTAFWGTGVVGDFAKDGLWDGGTELFSEGWQRVSQNNQILKPV